MEMPLAAREQFRIMIETHPEEARGYNGLGIAYDMAGDHPAAQKSYRMGLALQPENLNLSNNLAFSLILTGDHREAAGILERVVESPSATNQHRQNLALAYGLAGRETDARSLLLRDYTDDIASASLAYYQDLRSGDVSLRPSGAARKAGE